jgi:hypothetical protein
VVPGLRCIVAYCSFVGFAGCLGDDIHQWLVGKLGSGYQLVQVIDIAL